MKLESHIDTGSDDFAANRTEMETRLAEFEAAAACALAGGGERARCPSSRARQDAAQEPGGEFA